MKSGDDDEGKGESSNSRIQETIPHGQSRHISFQNKALRWILGDNAVSMLALSTGYAHNPTAERLILSGDPQFCRLATGH